MAKDEGRLKMVIKVTTEEALMIEAYKAMRKAVKTKGVSQEKKSDAISQIFKESMQMLDTLQVE